MSVKALFDSMPDAVRVEAIPKGLYFNWSMKGYGFGTLTLQAGEDGRLRADTECMSDETVLKILAQALREKVEVG